MHLVELIPDADVLCALEPYELGLRMLPVLAGYQPGSPVYNPSQLTLGAFLNRTLGSGPQPISQYSPELSGEIRQAICEAWSWLEGAALLVINPHYRDHVRQLSRRARQLAAEPNPQRAISAHRLAKDTLHPVIREDVWALYHRGKYDTAVFEAMKAVEVAVREAAQYSEFRLRHRHDWPGLQRGQRSASRPERFACRKDRPPIPVYRRAWLLQENPHSHRNVALDDPDEAAEIIALACHLLRIVDSRKAAGVTP